MKYCTRNPAIKKPEFGDPSSIVDINDNMDVIDGIICKSNYNSAVDPSASDDTGDGYSAGSHWWNITSHKLFVAESVATGAAVWRQVYPTLNPDGSVALTANWDAGPYEIRALTFESDQATGTAPLTIASTTKVTNLNADKLDGLDDTAFIKHSLATDINDFLIASGSGAFVKKTLAETKTILSCVTNGDSHDHSGGDGAQIDHGGLSGLGDDDHTQYLKLSGRSTLQTIANNILIQGNDGYNADEETATVNIGDTNVSIKAVRGFGLKISTYNAENCVTIAEQTGNMYVLGDVNCASVIDHTPGYDGDALIELKNVINDKLGHVDHKTLPAFAKSTFVDPETGKETEGRNIGNMVSILTKAVQQLTNKLEAAEKRIMELEMPKN